MCLILVLAPSCAFLAGIAVSNALSTYMKYLDSGSATGSSKVQPKDAKARKMDHRFMRVSQVSTGLGLLTAACRAILQVSQGFTGIFRLGTHQQRQ